jgi:antitoxin component YwqK of YwqJK toxin-antitoxin module
MNLNNIINRIKSINPNIKFVGSFDENNQKTGYWEYYYSNGKIRKKGNYLNGLEEGYWEIYYNCILRSKGNYVNGIKEGYWEEYWDSKLSDKGIYINGIYNELK